MNESAVLVSLCCLPGLFNLRGSDISYNPVFFGHALVLTAPLMGESPGSSESIDIEESDDRVFELGFERAASLLEADETRSTPTTSPLQLPFDGVALYVDSKKLNPQAQTELKEAGVLIRPYEAVCSDLETLQQHSTVLTVFAILVHFPLNSV